jgi:hypothetical protein
MPDQSNCNHRYPDGKKCCKCGHIRPNSESKTPNYVIERHAKELATLMFPMLVGGMMKGGRY